MMRGESKGNVSDKMVDGQNFSWLHFEDKDGIKRDEDGQEDNPRYHKW